LSILVTHRASLWYGETLPQPSVLIIDDDRGLATMIAFVLRTYGFSVDTANSGDEGLGLVSARLYNAVVLDLSMPGKDGRTVFREMREGGIQTPVLILSAYDAQRAKDELGAEAYLNKPFEPDALAERLQRMLGMQSSK
jgi:two-component system, OmpR family, response regulator